MVDGGGAYRISQCLVHRNALPGQGGFIHRTFPLQDHPVHRDALSGADCKHVPLLHLLRRNGFFLPVPDHSGGLGGKLHQTPDGVGGFSFGASLQHFSHRNQRQDHGGGLEIKLVHIDHDPIHIPMYLGIGHSEQGIYAPQKGCPGAEGNQRIHVGGAMPQALKAADKKFLVDDQDAPCKQQLHQSHCHMVPVKPMGQRPVPHHMPHGEIHQHQQQCHRGDEPAADPGGFRIPKGILGHSILLCPLEGCAVASRLHCCDHRIRGGSALHPHGIGQQIHRTAFHARHGGYRTLHPGAACGTAHARYLILLHFGSPHFISFCRVATNSSITSSCPARISRTTQPRM